MSQYRCESCDIPLTVEQLRIEVGICPSCRAELDAGYQANRRYWLARLNLALTVALVRQCDHLIAELVTLAPRAPWPTSGREVELTRERGEQ